MTVEADFEINKEPVKASFRELFKFSDKMDLLLMFLGALGSLFLGTSLTIFAQIIGNMVDSLNNHGNSLEEAKNNMLYLVYLGLGSLVIGMISNASWNISAGRQASRCRK